MRQKEYLSQVTRLVESGFTISQALDHLDIDAGRFYAAITKEQRMELDKTRASNRGIPRRRSAEIGTEDLHEFFTNNDEYAQ